MNTIDNIRELYRRRVDLHRAEKRLTLQIKALCRRKAMKNEDGTANQADAGKIYKAITKSEDHPAAATLGATATPLLDARALIESQRKATEKELTKLAKELPIYSWVERIRGVSALSLANIVGEAGDLSNYPNHRHLWKRMGLAVIEGERQRKVASNPDLAIQHGYSPERRSVMWNVGDCIIKAGEGHYRHVYDERKEYEIKTAEAEGLTVAPSAKIPARRAAEYRSEGHVHNRAKRYMEKCFLRDLWREWTGN